ncbi:tRNA uridine-5-carboxymethylaminomethyl(34) synthesis GTPase MnmE [Pseudoxanthomonas sp. PXM02]|uniref:tRNA uridine-5-carboxymethylaminomethyl(34) synthesis GTPase MnmE n=1 Tax=Pseudoxanthomonas sp. PXM02 TaxID=2769294 RepID=UPI0017834E86|nr:tRNA uridine-5-carboxymethylaminomethyl(34) synthesis GTPase MnmE [Pseudoxanthomonas sp. PXM02]MBD9480640.1 tRNA uridine-5-carboxymethylaminomethyl(34) synthesis GTPase MnmE [Pseudoxanthomonas sp. PXM02]
MTSSQDTIVAIATAPGAGGVGIVRLSGPAALAIAKAVCTRTLSPRRAYHVRFRDADGGTIDDGIALSFPGPASFTGEDVVELQAHGSPVVLQQLVARACALGARLARPGEFSERAFLNHKLDLAQAEAIADLIAASDARAARAARRSLEGVFSERVDAIGQSLLALRVHVEAAIDFADESIDTLGGEQVRARLSETRQRLQTLIVDAERGRKLRDGVHAVIVGPPNAGKSSLLNALAGSDRAIVTDVAGTTRDTLRETIRLDGLELHLVDTAGLRDGGDAIEREGMRRARAELERADVALAVVDARDPDAGRAAIADGIAGVGTVLWIHNKADLLASVPPDDGDRVYVSAAEGIGLDRLHVRLRSLAGETASEGGDGEFSARARHVDALHRAADHAAAAGDQLQYEQLELAAEELRLAHDALGDITGRLSADDMLGHIFSTFCIGK